MASHCSLTSEEVNLTDDQTLRDEFVCPITCDLIFDPVIAADGHTYDRAAIQGWLAKHETSPKTGKRLDSLVVVQNLNLKRLIGDLVEEGGSALYTKPCTSNRSRRRALVKERVLILKCVESSYPGQYDRVHYVGEEGAEGGRTFKCDALDRHFIQLFDDPTCSRRHFEITFNDTKGMFQIRDLGSTSGVLVRISHDQGTELHVGTTICLGKHQLIVDNIEKNAERSARLRLRCIGPSSSPLEGKMFDVGVEGALLGRKHEIAISFTALLGGKILGVDSKISMVHARIVYIFDVAKVAHRFVVFDGSENRPSSNGTWLRLSPMNQASKTWPLSRGNELVVGSSRFKVEEGTTIKEIANAV